MRRLASSLALLCALSLPGCNDEEHPSPRAPSGSVFDLTQRTDARTPATYRPQVHQVNVLGLHLGPPQGGPLYLHHPAELRGQIEVDAEPLREPLWYGLKSSNGARCVVGHVVLDHMAEMFPLAANATLAAQADALPAEPSLADCSQGACAAAGEQCYGFKDYVGSGGPDGPPPVNDDGMPAATEVRWQCATQAWAVAQTLPPTTISPADLAGNQIIEHPVGAVSELPDACAPLVDAPGVTVWAAFDPEGDTDFAERPAFDPPAQTDAAASPEADQKLAEERAFLQQLPFAQAEEVPVKADLGLDISLMHLTTGTSVLELSAEDRPTGDLEANAEFSVDGAPTDAQKAALADAKLSFAFTLQPAGQPRQGCQPPSNPPADQLAPVALTVEHGDDSGKTTEMPADSVAEHAEGVDHGSTFELHIPKALRDRLHSGDLACWDQVQLSACVSSSVPEASGDHLGADDNCQQTLLTLVRQQPAPAADEPPPPPPPEPSAGVQELWGLAGCNDGLIAQLADKRKRARELEDQAKVASYYTYDFERTLIGLQSLQEAGNEASGFTKALESCLLVCRDGGCFDRTPVCNPPGPIHSGNFRLALHFVSGLLNCLNTCETNDTCISQNAACGTPYGAHSGRFLQSVWYWRDRLKELKNSPGTYANDNFNSNCVGIATGNLCSEVGYDPNRMGELAQRIRDAASNHDRYSDFSKKMSGTYWHSCPFHYNALQRFQTGSYGQISTVADDNAFATKYLTAVCTRARLNQEADQIWNQIVTSCSNVSKPFNDAYVATGRFLPDLYRSYSSQGSGMKGVIEGGIVNDYFLDKYSGRFKLVFGGQGRIYVEGDPNHELLSAFSIYDIFKAWSLVHLYNDPLQSYFSAGFHALTHDIWKVEVRVPQGEFELPEGPELSKEKEKCKYLFKIPIPVRLELCGAVGGKLSLDVSAQVGRNDIDENNGDRPGAKGTVTPGVAITTSGRVGVDYWVGSAGVKLTLDPTIGVYLPITLGTTWDLRYNANQRRLDWSLDPFVYADLQVRALGGDVSLYVRNRLTKNEQTYPLYSWDPINLYSYRLFGQYWSITGSIPF